MKNHPFFVEIRCYNERNERFISLIWGLTMSSFEDLRIVDNFYQT